MYELTKNILMGALYIAFLFGITYFFSLHWILYLI